jgi:hypothetical protein
MAQEQDEAIDRLYGLPLDAFVAERDALAKALRADGKRDEAAAVKKLAKPTVAAWAVNQAVRTQKKAAGELWQAGDALAAAQDAILAGKGSGGDLRTAAERERAAVEPLVDAARGLLTASGGDLSEATIERVRQTLHAGAIDPDAREDVASGRATRERAPQGLFGGGEVAVAPTPRARKAEAAPRARKAEPATKPKRDAAAAKREREAAKREREEAARQRKEAAARERARKAAEQRVAKAEKAVAAAAERVEAARRDERGAVEALAEAKAELRALR